MSRIVFTYIIAVTLFAGCSRQIEKTEQWDVFEIVLDLPATGKPYMNVEWKAIFNNGKTSLTVPGFYDGNGVFQYKISINNRNQ